jgi:hypothetical protein
MSKKKAMCKCNKPPFYYFDFDIVELGISSNYEEVTIHTCKKCGQKWIKLFIEEEHYRKSGRWWRAPVNAKELKTISVESSKKFIESLDWCFVGGSYYDGKIRKEKRPIKID